MIFQEAVHENDELARAGGHGDERFLAGGTLIPSRPDRVAISSAKTPP